MSPAFCGFATRLTGSHLILAQFRLAEFSGSKDRAASIAKWQIHQLAKFVPAARDLVIHAPKAA